jgi:hypothetical protein
MRDGTAANRAMNKADDPSVLLAINIPIYRRPDLLEMCLRRTIDVVRDFGIWINLLDDSVDGTNEAAVGRLRDRYPRIRHIRNERNLGIDRNIDQAARFGDTDYIWLLGEDDYLLPGSIECILAITRSTDYPIIAVNYCAVSDDLRSVHKQSVMGVATGGEIASSELLELLGWSMGFIGACVVNRAAIGGVSPERYLGTYFAHLGCIFEAAYARQCMLIAEPLVANRSEDIYSATWAQDALRVYRGLERLLLLLSPPYTQRTVQLALRRASPLLAYKTTRGLASLRANGLLSLRSWRDVTDTSGIHLKIVALLMALLPKGGLKGLQRLVRHIRRQRTARPAA